MLVINIYLAGTAAQRRTKEHGKIDITNRGRSSSAVGAKAEVWYSGSGRSIQPGPAYKGERTTCLHLISAPSCGRALWVNMALGCLYSAKAINVSDFTFTDSPK